MEKDHARIPDKLPFKLVNVKKDVIAIRAMCLELGLLLQLKQHNNLIY